MFEIEVGISSGYRLRTQCLCPNFFSVPLYLFPNPLLCVQFLLIPLLQQHIMFTSLDAGFLFGLLSLSLPEKVIFHCMTRTILSSRASGPSAILLQMDSAAKDSFNVS
jgi:hypothetical protein